LPSPELAGSFSPLRYRDFRLIWLASLVSNLGGMAQLVGAAWLMATITASPKMVAMVQTANTLPLMVFALLTGALADVASRRLVMLASQLFMLLASAVLTASTILDATGPWALLVLVFLNGCGAAFYAPAWQASLRQQVPLTVLPDAVALNIAGNNLARTIGPALGGAIVASAGAWAAFAFNTLSYLALTVVIARWSAEPFPRARGRPSVAAAAAEGLRFVSRSRAARAVLARSFLFGATGIVVLALLPVVSKSLFSSDAGTYGLLLAAFGVGGTVGAIASASARRLAGRAQVAFAGTVAMAAAPGALSLSPGLPVAAAALLASGACWIAVLSTYNVTVQLSSPAPLVGRMLAIYQMASFGGMAVGSLIWGHLAETMPLAQVLVVAAGATLAAGLASLAFRLPPDGGVREAEEGTA